MSPTTRRLGRIAISLVATVFLGVGVAQAASVRPAATERARAVAGCAETHVLLLGDSNIYGALGKEIARALPAMAFEVVRRGKPTSGLARPDFFDWFNTARELIDRHEPDVVIIMLGGNDGQRLERVHEHEGERILWRDERAWRDEYFHRVRDLMTLLRGEHRRVFFLSPTNRRPRLAREKMLRVREVQRAAADSIDGVEWIDMFPLSSDANGNWLKGTTDARGARVRYRRSDGIHLTPEGAAVVASRVVERLVQRGLAACGPM